MQDATSLRIDKLWGQGGIGQKDVRQASIQPSGLQITDLQYPSEEVRWGVEVLLHRFFASGSCRTLNADEASDC